MTTDSPVDQVTEAEQKSEPSAAGQEVVYHYSWVDFDGTVSQKQRPGVFFEKKTKDGFFGVNIDGVSSKIRARKTELEKNAKTGKQRTVKSVVASASARDDEYMEVRNAFSFASAVDSSRRKVDEIQLVSECSQTVLRQLAKDLGLDAEFDSFSLKTLLKGWYTVAGHEGFSTQIEEDYRTILALSVLVRNSDGNTVKDSWKVFLKCLSEDSVEDTKSAKNTLMKACFETTENQDEDDLSVTNISFGSMKENIQHACREKLTPTLESQLSPFEQGLLTNALTLDGRQVNVCLERLIAAKKFNLDFSASTQQVEKEDIAIKLEKKIYHLYAFMHHAAAEHPGEDIVIDFYDDRQDILDAIKVYFEKHPELVPPRVTFVGFRHQYKGHADVNQSKPAEVGAAQVSPVKESKPAEVDADQVSPVNESKPAEVDAAQVSPVKESKPAEATSKRTLEEDAYVVLKGAAVGCPSSVKMSEEPSLSSVDYHRRIQEVILESRYTTLHQAHAAVISVPQMLQHDPELLQEMDALKIKADELLAQKQVKAAHALYRFRAAIAEVVVDVMRANVAQPGVSSAEGSGVASGSASALRNKAASDLTPQQRLLKAYSDVKASEVSHHRGAMKVVNRVVSLVLGILKVVTLIGAIDGLMDIKNAVTGGAEMFKTKSQKTATACYQSMLGVLEKSAPEQSAVQVAG